MGLFMIEHRHSPEMCPKNDVEAVRQLSQHVTQASADKFGARLLADFVYEAEHLLTIVLEADTADQAASFALPFLKFGSVTIKEGQTCSEVAIHCVEMSEPARA